MTVKGKNVYILGPAYCGSTLLGNSLNGHSSISYAGEISRLPPFGKGDPTTECPICCAKAQPCSVWTEDLINRMSDAGPGKSLDLYREVTGSPVIVDGSKHPDWFREVHAHNGLSENCVAIVSVRNPLAFASSAIRRDGYPAWQCANIWRDTMFDIIRSLSVTGVPYIVVRYEDFAYSPEKKLRQICDFLGLEFDPGMLEFWKFPIHAIGGNAGAYVWYEVFRERGKYTLDEDRVVAEMYAQRDFGGWHDTKWKEMLSPNEISLMLSMPGFVDMCSMMGYHIAATAISSPTLK